LHPERSERQIQTPMNCSTIQPLLRSYVDQELSPDQVEQVVSHVDTCARCRVTVIDMIHATNGNLTASDLTIFYIDETLDPLMMEIMREHIPICATCHAEYIFYMRYDEALRTLPFLQPSSKTDEAVLNSSSYYKAVHKQWGYRLVPRNRQNNTQTKPETAKRIAVNVTKRPIQIAALVLVTLAIAVGIIAHISSSAASPSGCSMPLRPDGTRLVYRTSTTLRSETKNLLCATHDPIKAGWQVSPSGMSIMYITAPTNSTHASTMHIASSDSTNDMVLNLGDGTPVMGAWSPQGDQLAVLQSLGDTRYTLLFITNNGNIRAHTKTFNADHIQTTLVWSQDGANVAWAQDTSDKTLIVVANSANDSLTGTTVPSQVTSLIWTTGGTPYLSWTVTSAGNIVGVGARVITSTGVDVRTTPLSNIASMTFAPKIGIWAAIQREGSVEEIDALSHQVTPLVQLKEIHQLEWSPDGSSLIAVGSTALWQVKSNVVTPLSGQIRDAIVAWSPDGTVLTEVSHGQVFTYTPASGQSQKLAQLDAATYDPILDIVWSSDSKKFSLHSTQGIAIITLHGQVQVQLIVETALDVPQWTNI
jgi:Putative zinc-finger